MAHLITFRTAPSFTQGEGLIQGTHETTERNISRLQYSVSKVRKGYTRPFASTWHFIDYRVKTDVLPVLVKDIGGVILNPYPNTMTLRKLLKPNSKNNVESTTGIVFRLVQYLFKWVNRKYLSSFFLLLLHASSYFGVHIIGLLPVIVIIIALFVNPLKPIPTNGVSQNKVRTGWQYNFHLGYLKDMDVRHGLKKEKVHTDAL